MSSLFGLKKPNTDLRKNVFDLSEKNLFHLSAGMLLPCMVKECNPGEKFQVNLASVVRTKELNTAAFVRCRQYYHFFFVPYKQLWSGWDNFITGMDYRQSALQSKDVHSSVPTMDLFSVLLNLDNANRIAPLNANDASSKKGKHLDEMGVPYYLGMSRLLDMLGYGMHSNTRDNISHLSSLTELVENLIYGNPANNSENILVRRTSLTTAIQQLFRENKFVVNPFRLLAYQKIYSDFYKRDDYEATQPGHFNIDDFSAGQPIGQTFSSSGVTPVNDERILGMLRMRYRWQPKDYFTGVVPSELYNVGSLSSLTDALSRSMDTNILLDSGADSIGTIEIPTSNGAINTKMIHAAFAIEKLQTLSRRAGAHDYISQISAHYGFDVPRGRGDKVEFLGGYTNNIDINAVITSATTQQASAGDVAAYGAGSFDGGKDIEFTAKEHGILMCITSVVPEVDYSSEGLDRFNAKFERGDYFHPEFQNLGLQPIFGFELKNYWASRLPGVSYIDSTERYVGRPVPGTLNGYTQGRLAAGNVQRFDEARELIIDNPNIKNTRNAILGFVPRYAEYKVGYDKLHGEFRVGRSLSAWSGNNLLDYDSTGVKINTLKIDARCLNRVFAIRYDGRETNDQFMCGAQFIVKAIRPMSITGQSI